MGRKAEVVGKELLDKFIEIMKIYNETVDKTFHNSSQSPSYEKGLKSVEKACEELYMLRDALFKSKLKIQNLEPLLDALENALLTFKVIVVGLRNNQNKRKRYGWFKYQKDIRLHETARQLLAKKTSEFMENVETIPEEPNFIEVRALVVDPFASDVIEDKIKILDSQYEESEKDDLGRIYIMRSYNDQGDISDVILTENWWLTLKDTFYTDSRQ